MMNPISRILAVLLCAVVLLGEAAVLSACGNAEEPPVPAGTGDTAVSEAVTDVPDPFADVNYNGREFRINTSVNAVTSYMGNSNHLIEGSGKTTGEPVNDAVYERNLVVEEKLGVRLTYTHTDVTWDGTPEVVRRLIASGTDEHDVIINDLFPFATLSVEGSFRNVLSEECVFDFDQPYWYKDFMDDLRMMDGYEYMLAGDYFIDIIRSAHVMLYNKDMYQKYTHRDPNEVYGWVENYEWTLQKLNEMITGYYADTNLNNVKDYGDQYGMPFYQFWDSTFHFVVSASPGFITRDENGVPSFIMGEDERAEKMVEDLTALFWNESASVGVTGDEQLLPDFVSGMSLVCDRQRLGSLENALLRDMQQEFGVLPLPMLTAEDRKYTTCAHDTTEVGAILATSTDLAFISTVLEVLDRESANIVIPKYYKESLQIRYVNDPYASEMVGIVHDNFANAFVLAYNNLTGSVILNVPGEAVENKRTFSVCYKKSATKTQKLLKKAVETFKKKNNVT